MTIEERMNKIVDDTFDEFASFTWVRGHPVEIHEMLRIAATAGGAAALTQLQENARTETNDLKLAIGARK